MVPLEQLGDTSRLRLEQEAVALFADLDNQPLTAVDFVEESGIDLNGDYSGYFFSGSSPRYMIVGRDIAGTDCRVVLAVGEQGYFGALDVQQSVFFILSVLALVLIPLILWGMTRSILRPVDEIRGTMEQIRAGKLDAKAGSRTNIREFSEMNETFNTMMEQIKDLKIESYESELDKQKAELRYLPPPHPPCQRNIELQSPNGFLPPVTKVTVGTFHTSIPKAILKCTPITQKI